MEFEINIPPELDEVMVPKLTLQPLAENALYHGINTTLQLFHKKISYRTF